MKIFVIGSDAAVWGFALTGVSGRIVETGAELNAALDETLLDEEIGILLITTDVAAWARERIETLLVQPEGVLIVEIPGPQGAPLLGQDPRGPGIGELLRRTVGVKI
jgi:vacuolar-type H+-ATPase subunit F/Vma7